MPPRPERTSHSTVRTIAHISDLHFGRVENAVAEGLAADLKTLRPDLLVASGDFTQRARRRQYAAAAAYLQRLPTPQLVIPGNHDIPLFDLPRRFFAPLARYRQYINPDLRPFYQDQELAILGINTARSFHWRWNGFWKDGRISEEQLLDVKLRLGGLPQEIFKIVVTHHPFIPPPGERKHGMVGRADHALDMMERCGVDMLLAGHLHMGYSGDVRTHYEALKRSILSIQAGTATSTRRRREPNAYNLIRINLHQVSVEVRTWTGTHFAPSTLKTYRRLEGFWHEASRQEATKLP